MSQYDDIEFTLRSGRTFRYQMRDYPFRVFATEAELDELCCQIIKDKYRYCAWDREHPKTDAEVEIYDAIREWMMEEVAKAHQLRAEMDAHEGEPGALGVDH